MADADERHGDRHFEGHDDLFRGTRLRYMNLANVTGTRLLPALRSCENIGNLAIISNRSSW